DVPYDLYLFPFSNSYHLNLVLSGILRVDFLCFFFSSRRRHTRFDCDWSSDVCSSDLSPLSTSCSGRIGRFRPASTRNGSRWWPTSCPIPATGASASSRRSPTATAARWRASSSSSRGRSCPSGRSTTSSASASPAIPTSPACSCPTTGRGTRSARTIPPPGCPSSSRKRKHPDDGDPVTMSPRDLVLGPEAWPESDETMIINLGPQHPSTHGVLRVMLELEGETVLRAKPVIGYLHTGMEKTGEQLTYVQGPTNVTRMDYAAPLFNELVYSM